MKILRAATIYFALVFLILGLLDLTVVPDKPPEASTRVKTVLEPA